MFRQLFLLLIAASAHATTVYPELRKCPVCGVKSVSMSLGSYSQFGEPARDLSDFPQFQFANVEVCPGDLYASWADAWKTVDAGEEARLTDFLKTPALHLTDAEKSIIADHEKAFRESGWFKPLWARTCDGFRNSDDRRNLRNILRLHFAGSYLGRERAAEGWEKQLVVLFHENAITALKDAAAAKWPKPTEQRIFAYLRAELTRQAGRDEEAFLLFQEVIASEKTAKPDEELAWISRWASEQSLRSGPSLADDPNDTQVTNAVRRAVGGTDDRKIWRKEVLLPMVRKSAAEVGIPKIEIPKDHRFDGLPPLDGGTPAMPPDKPTYNELSRELYELWGEQPSARSDIACIYIRILRQAEESKESTQYPVMYFLPAIGETEESRAVIRRELDGPWKSSFWKAICAYAARLPDSAEAFTHHPFTAHADDGLIFKMLAQRSDASFEDIAIAKLNKDEWVSSELINYLVSLDLPETRLALDTFAKQIRNQAGVPKRTGMPDGKLSALQQIDGSRVEALLRALPIR